MIAVAYGIMLLLALVGAAIYFGARWLGRQVTPSFGALEIESDRYAATAIIRGWKSSGKFGYAVGALLVDLFVFIPTYVIVGGLLAFVAGLANKRPTMSALDSATILFIPLIAVAAFVNVIQDAWLMFWFMTNKARGASVAVWLGRTKFGIAALSIMYAILWVMLQVHEHSLPYVRMLPVLLLLFPLLAFVALLFARTATKLSKHRPSLLELSLAPNALAAKDVIERWGENGRLLALRALKLDSLLAVIYGLLLAALCSEYVLEGFDVVAMIAAAAVVVALAAAALHLAQNFGAYVALRSEPAGWWIGLMRKIGWVRITMLLVVTVFYCGQAYVYLVDWTIDKAQQFEIRRRR